MILKKPITTEKMQGLSKIGKYGFEVDKKSNKLEIARAVEKMYGVSVASVSTMIQAGKNKTRSTRKSVSSGYTGSIKKAIVTLKEGEMIDFYADL